MLKALDMTFRDVSSLTKTGQHLIWPLEHDLFLL